MLLKSVKLSKTEGPRTKIVISQIIERTDNPQYKQEIENVNNKLSKYCDRHKLGLFKHTNIEHKHINPYGVHLNRFGTSVLARNILNYVNKDECS